MKIETIEAPAFSGNLTITDTTREPHKAPCPDCGRTYLNGENVTISVPAPDGGYRTPWSGCVDCWVKRTSPGRGLGDQEATDG